MIYSSFSLFFEYLHITNISPTFALLFKINHDLSLIILFKNSDRSTSIVIRPTINC